MTTPAARPAGPAAPGGIAGASVSRAFDAPATVVFAALTDVRNHGRWVPQTRIRTDGEPRVGTRIEAVSGPLARFGAPGLTDRMQITAYDPPTGDDAHATAGVAVFRKDGPVLLGTATITVEPRDAGSCRATFREHVTLAGPLPGALTSRLTAPGFDVMLRVVLRRAARELEG